MEAIIFAIFAAIPFYFIWNALAPIYFTFLPAPFHQLPFWHCMGLLVLLAIIRVVLVPSPTFVNKSKFFWKKN